VDHAALKRFFRFAIESRSFASPRMTPSVGCGHTNRQPVQIRRGIAPSPARKNKRLLVVALTAERNAIGVGYAQERDATGGAHIGRVVVVLVMATGALDPIVGAPKRQIVGANGAANRVRRGRQAGGNRDDSLVVGIDGNQRIHRMLAANAAGAARGEYECVRRSLRNHVSGDEVRRCRRAVVAGQAEHRTGVGGAAHRGDQRAAGVSVGRVGGNVRWNDFPRPQEGRTIGWRRVGQVAAFTSQGHARDPVVQVVTAQARAQNTRPGARSNINPALGDSPVEIGWSLTLGTLLCKGEACDQQYRQR